MLTPFFGHQPPASLLPSPPAPDAGSSRLRPTQKNASSSIGVKSSDTERKKQQQRFRPASTKVGVGGGSQYVVEMRGSIRGGWRSFSLLRWFSDTPVLEYATRVHPGRSYTTTPQLVGEKGILVRDPAGKRSDFKSESHACMNISVTLCVFVSNTNMVAVATID